MSLADKGQVCKIRPSEAPLLQQTDSTNSTHILFVRCHPDGQHVFSNRVPLTGDSFGSMRPSMIDMKTGKVTDIPIPTDFEGRFSAEDLVPSPDGEFLYADVAAGSHLGVYKMEDGALKQLDIIKVHGEESGHYGYPSPAIRRGQRLILSRRVAKDENKLYAGRPYIDKIEQQGNQFKLIPGPEICPSFKLNTMNTMINMPYISGDGEYFGAKKDETLHIFKLRWDLKRRIDGKDIIPCEVVRTLPPGAGKVSFSPDNKKVVFHVNNKDFIGYPNDGYYYNPESYIMDIESGDIQSLSDLDDNRSSEYPYFCGDNGIVIRETLTEKPYTSSFSILPIPSEPKTKVFINDCEVQNAANRTLISAWQGICEEYDHRNKNQALDINVTTENCSELISYWRKHKTGSSITITDIEAACR